MAELLLGLCFDSKLRKSERLLFIDMVDSPKFSVSVHRHGGFVVLLSAGNDGKEAGESEKVGGPPAKDKEQIDQSRCTFNEVDGVVMSVDDGSAACLIHRIRWWDDPTGSFLTVHS